MLNCNVSLINTHFFLGEKNCFITSLNLRFCFTLTSSTWLSISTEPSLGVFSISADTQSPQLLLFNWESFRLGSLVPDTFVSEWLSLFLLSDKVLRVLLLRVLEGELPGVSETPESARLSREIRDKLFLLPDKGEDPPETTLEVLEQTECRAFSDGLLLDRRNCCLGIQISEECSSELSFSFVKLGSDNTLSFILFSCSFNCKVERCPKETGRGLGDVTAFFLKHFLDGLHGGVTSFLTFPFSSSAFSWLGTVLLSSMQSWLLSFSFERGSISPWLSCLSGSSVDRRHFLDLRCQFRIKLPAATRNMLCLCKGKVKQTTLQCADFYQKIRDFAIVGIINIW